MNSCSYMICSYCSAAFAHIEGPTRSAHDFDPRFNLPQCSRCRRKNKWVNAHPPSPVFRQTLSTVYELRTKIPVIKQHQQHGQNGIMKSATPEVKNGNDQEEDHESREECMAMPQKSLTGIWEATSNNNLALGVA